MKNELEKRQAAERTRAAARRRLGEIAGRIPVKCPKCGYEATWLPAENGFSPALDMYTKCPEVTAHLDRGQSVAGDPRTCRKLRDAWVKIVVRAPT
jgi:hypothetical protein